MAVSLDGGPPFPGVVDISATVSTLNWAAAEGAGLNRDSKGLLQVRGSRVLM